MSCSLDYSPPDFYKSVERTSRKSHTCCECGHVIVPGERYEHVTGKWEGHLGQFRTCNRCVDLREALADVSGGCFEHGGLHEGYWEYLVGTLGAMDKVREAYFRVMSKHKAALK